MLFRGRKRIVVQHEVCRACPEKTGNRGSYLDVTRASSRRLLASGEGKEGELWSVVIPFCIAHLA